MTTLGEDSKVKVSLLTVIVPIIVACAVSLAVGSIRADVFEKRLDYNTTQRGLSDDRIDKIREDVAEIKGMLKEMQRHERN